MEFLYKAGEWRYSQCGPDQVSGVRCTCVWVFGCTMRGEDTWTVKRVYILWCG